MIFHRCHKYKVSHLSVLFDGLLVYGIGQMIFHKCHKYNVSHLYVLLHAA